jgi:hypothetical protein
VHYVRNRVPFGTKTVLEARGVWKSQNRLDSSSSSSGDFSSCRVVSKMAPYSLYAQYSAHGSWSNVVHYIGNRVPFGMNFRLTEGQALFDCDE